MLNRVPGFREDIDDEIAKIKEDREERMPNTDVRRQKPGAFQIDGEPKSDI